MWTTAGTFLQAFAWWRSGGTTGSAPVAWGSKVEVVNVLKYLVKNQQFEPALGILELQEPFKEHWNEWSGSLNEDPDHHQRVVTLLLHKTNTAFPVRPGFTSQETRMRWTYMSEREKWKNPLSPDLKLGEWLEFLLTDCTAGLKGPHVWNVVSQVVDLELDRTFFFQNLLFTGVHD